jgi:importin-7
MIPYIVAIIQDVIFPLLCYSEADDELWESDPVEYIRLEFDVFDDYTSPVPAARMLRPEKGVLPQVMQVLLQVCKHLGDIYYFLSSSKDHQYTNY